MATKWTTQRSKRKGGYYYQAILREDGKVTRTVGLGTLAEEVAGWVSVNLAWAAENLEKLTNREIKRTLTQDPAAAEVAMEALTMPASPTDLAGRDLSRFTLAEFVKHVHTPLRRPEVAGSTLLKEKYGWKQILQVLGDVRMRAPVNFTDSSGV